MGMDRIFRKVTFGTLLFLLATALNVLVAVAIAKIGHRVGKDFRGVGGGLTYPVVIVSYLLVSKYFKVRGISLASRVDEAFLRSDDEAEFLQDEGEVVVRFSKSLSNIMTFAFLFMTLLISFALLFLP